MRLRKLRRARGRTRAETTTRQIVHPCSASPAIGELIEQVSTDDRRWFIDHPGATARIRPYRPGEFWPAKADGSGWLVHVRQVRPGYRLRRLVEVATGATGNRTGFFYDLATGEVLGELGGSTPSRYGGKDSRLIERSWGPCRRVRRTSKGSTRGDQKSRSCGPFRRNWRRRSGNAGQ